MTIFSCEICGLIFNNPKLKANHVRWKHNNNDVFKQKIRAKCLNLYDKKFGKIKIFDVKCHRCSKNFTVEERENLFPKKEKYFCSKICSSQYSRSFLTKENQLNGIKKYFDDYPPRGNTIYNLICKVCGNPFKNKNKTAKTCGRDCYRKLCSKNARENPNCGGETNYKKYKYKDIWMDSNWEKKLAEWMDEKNIIWERSRKHVLFWTDQNNKKRRYYPDFYLPEYNLFLDTKNPYLMKCDKNKINCVLKENDIQLIVNTLNCLKKILQKIL